ncbi:hypothetical protein BK809_0004157 [Diplodia seriata]|uniref:Uncharacterized protein n=1 Tax=Diplodia seriata TaxID=420778 RepID=A0A1S8BD89_9PEZI|nr:hypothetical protein BK809_0004157 [Diplodia seriata]
MFDTSRHFGITVPALAQTQPPLLYAILALSAHLCGALISDGTESTLLALRKWVPASIHSSSPSPSHSNSNINSNPDNDDDNGDATADAVHDLFASRRSPDMHANYAVYLCSRVCELLADRTKYAELGVDNGCTGRAYARRWARLWRELARWLDERPAELLPARTVGRGVGGGGGGRRRSRKEEGGGGGGGGGGGEENDDDDDRSKNDNNKNNKPPFPEILFVHWAAISSNQLYHTACILLLTSMPPKSNSSSLELAPLPVHNPLWHARRVCGISLSNPHEGCLNNACQPLWIAGRMLGHHSEHAAVIDLIRNIEARTGWGMYWRIRDLEEAWGYRTTTTR